MATKHVDHNSSTFKEGLVVFLHIRYASLSITDRFVKLRIILVQPEFRFSYVTWKSIVLKDFVNKQNFGSSRSFTGTYMR
jgi:hypothetical protein